MEYKYLLSLNTNKSLCYVDINGMPAMDNNNGSNGIQSSGLNATAFLENGTNTIALLFSDLSDDIKSNKFDPEAWCEATLKKVSVTGTNEIIGHIKLTVDKDGNTVTSPNKIGNGKSEFEFSGMATNPEDDGLYKAQKRFSIRGLPDWMWTKAHPVTENDLPAIKNFYQDIINTLAHKDLDKLWKMSKPAWDEWAMAEDSNPRIFFNSMNFEELTDDKLYTIRIYPEWKKLKLVSYKSGRLFRLEEGAFGRSPILMDNKKTGDTATYSPYLSIIDGKVVIAR
ncbi:hypothetical protein Xbed_03660 [Xenorhabdus beddingii]|uniref:Uncharacterized protein n=2 Tax=Xenorhabdus beddingii TaxID=40578 RepID=A0A1Y2SAV8_9GAMM|nr:hypothetical protein [Xenorhabdus beddingii]OTA14648.1 hypothetical protein Xbed_03660 [Xenorhabdus beddingii]